MPPQSVIGNRHSASGNPQSPSLDIEKQMFSELKEGQKIYYWRTKTAGWKRIRDLGDSYLKMIIRWVEIKGYKHTKQWYVLDEEMRHRGLN